LLNTDGCLTEPFLFFAGLTNFFDFVALRGERSIPERAEKLAPCC
jgi:hypothetical protein